MSKHLISVLIATSAIVSAASASAGDARGSIELVSGLTECVGQLEAADQSPSAIEGVGSAKTSSLGALQFVTGSERLASTQRMAVDEAREAFAQRLALDPMNTRQVINALRKKCMDYVYQAEDLRVAEVEENRLAAAEKREAEIKLRQQEAKLAKQQALTADRANALELAKIKAETERLKIEKDAALASENAKLNFEGKKVDATLASENAKLNLEGRKIDASTSVDLGRITAETERARIDRTADVESERTKAGVEIAKINANAAVAVTTKVAEVAVVHENQRTERTKLDAASRTDVAKAQAEAVSNTVSQSAKIESERTKAMVEIANNQITAQTDVAKTQAAAGLKAVEAVASAQTDIARSKSSSNNQNDGESSGMVSASLECGAFYRTVSLRASEQQRPTINKLSAAMFDFARKSGATEDMITASHSRLMTKFSESAAKSKQSLEKELLGMKSKCSTLDQVIRL